MTLSPSLILQRLQIGQINLIPTELASGKSRVADQIIGDPAYHRFFRQIRCWVTRYDILAERAHVKSINHKTTRLLQPRPRKLCEDHGHGRDWALYERTVSYALAKARLCSKCQACDWPNQFVGISNCIFVFGVQHLLPLVKPLLIPRDGTQVLDIVDEALAIGVSMRVVIPYEVLKVFAGVLEQTLGTGGISSDEMKKLRLWLAVLQGYLGIAPGFRPLALPDFRPPTVLAIQDIGVKKAMGFRYLGGTLMGLHHYFTWQEPNGDLISLQPPAVPGATTLILSARADADYLALKYRTAVHVVVPYQRLLHPQTIIYNLRSRITSASNFLGNCSQILDFAALLVKKHSSKKCLFVVKKQFIHECKTELENRLHRLFGHRIPIWSPSTPASPAKFQVAIISYGYEGVNTFEHYQMAMALCSYQINDAILNVVANDSFPSSLAARYSIVTSKNQRFVRLLGRSTSDFHGDSLGNIVLFHSETMAAIQTLGRVRFTIHPRLMIFCQKTDLGYNEIPVDSLDALRQTMGIPLRKTYERTEISRKITEMRATGVDTQTICDRLKISRATFYRL